MAFDRVAYLKAYVERNKTKLRKQSLDYQKSDIGRDRWYKRKYGIGVEQYKEMFAKQEGRCAICHKHQTELAKQLHVDHNHTTKQVRGLLCSHCNMAVGYIHEDATAAKNLEQYLLNNPPDAILVVSMP